MANDAQARQKSIIETSVDGITKPVSQSLTDKRIVDTCIQQRLLSCDYRFVLNKITWQYEEGSLTLSGCVPNFYLKQMLQELLRGTEHVERIYNDVDVVSSTGLSSVRPK